MEEEQQRAQLSRTLKPHWVWAIALGSAVGWGAFVLPVDWLGTAGPLGAILGFSGRGPVDAHHRGELRVSDPEFPGFGWGVRLRVFRVRAYSSLHMWLVPDVGIHVYRRLERVGPGVAWAGS